MECFIKRVWRGQVDEQVHRQFVRFSRGTFPGRAALSLVKKDSIKLGGSFEFANDFSNVVAELDKSAKFSGIILSKHELAFPGRKKSEVYEYIVQDISSEQVLEAGKKAYALLLDGQGSGISLKMKKKLPKPGKSGEAKIDDKFCAIEADLKYWPKIKEGFMLPECSKAKISHVYVIEDVIVDRNEKDFAKMRESAKKKGKIVRKMSIDKQESQEEKSFEA